jgi:hypothetical protein
MAMQGSTVVMTAKHSGAFLLGLAAFLLAACDGVAPPASPPELKFRADVPGATLAQPGSGGASGSGCLPATAPLPDGVWFGFIMAWEAESVEFDPACWYAGEAASAKAAERGDEPPPNGVYFVNDDTATRRVAVAPGADARRISPPYELTDYDGLRTNPGEDQVCLGRSCPFWLFVNGGKATSLRPQVAP